MINNQLSYSAAFGLPAVLLLVATTIFFSGRKKYRTHSPQGSVLRDAAKVLLQLLIQLLIDLLILLLQLQTFLLN